MSEVAENATAPAEPTNEVAPAEAPKVEVPSSGKILDLAKKEAQFVKKEVEYKQQLAKAQEELKELQYFRNAKQVYKENPEELLGKLGIGYDELTNAIMDYYENKDKGAKTPSVEEVRKQVEEEFSKRESVKAEKEAAAAIESFSKEINQFVKENENTFPHLTKLGTTLGGVQSTDELIFDVVSNYFQETGQILDLKVAAETAEEYFREEWGKLNGVLSGKPAEKVEEKQVVSTPAPVAKPATNEEAPVSVSKFRVKDQFTITNNMRPVSSVPYKGKDFDRRDIIERAVQTYENVARRPK
jgi:chromosome segregation ATPase